MMSAGPPRAKWEVNCGVVTKVIRAFTVITYLTTLAACGWGFVIANQLFSASSIAGLDISSLAIFQGLMAVYYSAFSIVGALAEIRTLRLKQTILYPFGFMQTWLGRGVFLILIGVVFVIIPWDNSRVYVSKVPAAFQLTSGVLQIIIGIFVVKSPDAASAAGIVADGNWGETAGGGGAFHVRQGADGTVSTTPLRRVKMAVAARPSPNPLHKGDEAAEAAEGATAPVLPPPSGVPAANPFK